MRVYCPVNALAGDTSVTDMSSPTFDLPAKARVWGVPTASTTALSGDEVEEREFEALCECILSFAHANRGASRIAIAAFDLPDRALERDSSPETGEWSHVLRSEAYTIPLKAYLITQNSASEVADDPYAPDALWFDPSEASSVREFLEG
ncbi:Uncharacterised protein [Mycobacteroides abscessus subsp. abscessus]|uniref:Uncharacterized protein n=1 Tax=Dermabacter vaginalis TaxID=1630135 RepID=A0A1B0ZJI7_9MICO|nr:MULTISPECIES: hypothetical protein [Dermabacter]SHX48165.1 Uncharacterised protein [Mycobacteroides abscessus subsp. abscessus]ANP28048.1 hypothetical protein DAD186_14980 [Dermabacter vaginalis]MCG7442992.1 hypothetical protein [Dermabacter vaginalis]QEU11545.1 hypothetical protein FOB48_04045 [Dermabacter vaginalis]RUP87510.1 hypothetical protein D8M36_02780 [Dermabacter sp. HSID17554]